MYFHTLLHQLKAHRATLRAMGKPVPPLRKPPVPQYPWGPERQYAAALEQRVERLREIATRVLERRLDAVVAEAGMTRATQDEWVDEATAITDAINTQYQAEWSPADTQDLARAQGVDLSHVNAQQFYRLLSEVFGVNPILSEPWLASHIKSFTQTNVGLIESLPPRALGTFQTELLANIRQGKRSTELIPLLTSKPFDVTKSWARFIARDQTAKYNADLSEVRHREAGINQYTWWTAMDERVRGRPGGLYPNARPSHWAHQGKVYSYDHPPADTGAPGHDYNCRCVAIPYFGDFEKSLDSRGWRSRIMAHA